MIWRSIAPGREQAGLRIAVTGRSHPVGRCVHNGYFRALPTSLGLSPGVDRPQAGRGPEIEDPAADGSPCPERGPRSGRSTAEWSNPLPEASVPQHVERSLMGKVAQMGLARARGDQALLRPLLPWSPLLPLLPWSPLLPLLPWSPLLPLLP